MQTNFTGQDIRAIRLSDVDNVVNVHMESFQGFFLTFLGRRFLKIFYEGVISEPSGIGIMVGNEGGIAGFIVGVHNPSGFYGRLLKRDWMRFGLSSAPAIFKKPRTLVRLLRALAKPLDTPAGNAVELSSVAVLPSCQGQGIGRRLISAFIKEATIRGAEYVYLATDELDNGRARNLYERSGFTLYKKYATRDRRPMCEYRYVMDRTASDKGASAARMSGGPLNPRDYKGDL